MTRSAAVTGLLGVVIALTACGTSTSNEVTCEAGDTLVLSAQAVPSATMIPCITAFPTGWGFGGFAAKSGLVRYWMNSDRAGTHAAEVKLGESCDTSGAVPTNSFPELDGVEVYERMITSDPPSGVVYLTFAGGCVTMDYAFAEGATADLVAELVASTTLVPRIALATKLEEDQSLVLCGAGGTACP